MNVDLFRLSHHIKYLIIFVVLHDNNVNRILTKQKSQPKLKWTEMPHTQKKSE